MNKVSFCTTLMNRGNHLAQTLPQNLANNPGEEVEFVILDYGDKYGVKYDEETKEGGTPLKQWLIENFPDEIANGRVKYARTEQPHFRMAHAKNMAHRLATGDILCNLDADNVTGEGFAGWLKQQFTHNSNIIVRGTAAGNLLRAQQGFISKGTGGRIAISAENFKRLHGYNEVEHNGYTGDDDAFLKCSLAMGLKQVDPGLYQGTVIQHSDAERLEHLEPKDKERSGKHFAIRDAKSQASLPWRAYYKIKRILKESMGGAKAVSANPGGHFGCGEVEVGVGVLNHDRAVTTLTLTPHPHPEWKTAYAPGKAAKVLEQRAARSEYLSWGME